MEPVQRELLQGYSVACQIQQAPSSEAQAASSKLPVFEQKARLTAQQSAITKFESSGLRPEHERQNYALTTSVQHSVLSDTIIQVDEEFGSGSIS